MWKGFQKPKRLAAELESLTDKFGKFSAQPFERGWGTTVGNALRRALLSSIEGAAITAVKIEGVLHEFSLDSRRRRRCHRHHPQPEAGSAQAEQRPAEDDHAECRESPGVVTSANDRRRRRFRGAGQEHLHRHGQRRRQARSSRCASRTAAATSRPTATSTKICRSATSPSIRSTRRCAR